MSYCQDGTNISGLPGQLKNNNSDEIIVAIKRNVQESDTRRDATRNNS